MGPLKDGAVISFLGEWRTLLSKPTSDGISCVLTKVSKTSGSALYFEHSVSGCADLRPSLPVPCRHLHHRRHVELQGCCLRSQSVRLAGAPTLHTPNLFPDMSGLKILGMWNLLMPFLTEKAHGLVPRTRPALSLIPRGTNDPAAAD